MGTDVLLVPVPLGIDPSDARPPDFWEASTPASDSRLVTHRVAVALGLRSGGLLAIRFVERAQLSNFLERNPSTRQTLITEHADGPVIWFKCNVAHRLPLHLAHLSVLMSGSILVYDRATLGCRDAILNSVPITPVDLASLHWGPDADGTVAAWLAGLAHGTFFKRGGRGRMIPNTQAWLVYLAARLKPTIAFDTRDERFYGNLNAGGWQPLTDHQMRDELRRQVIATPVGTAESKARLSDEWLVRVCRKLKTSLEAHLPLVEARLREFLIRHLVKEPGANVTNAELAETFTTHAEPGQPLMTPKQFRVLVGRILRHGSFVVCYSKSLKRPGGQQNGWRGVRLKDGSIPPRN